MKMNLLAFGLGIGSRNKDTDWLEVYYPDPLWQPKEAFIEELANLLGYTGGNAALELSNEDLARVKSLPAMLRRLADSSKPLVAMFIEKDEKPASVPEAYLKLHLLSHRLVRPNSINLSEIFKILPNVAWTSRGAIDLKELPQVQLEARLRGEMLEVISVDKFPKMTDYVVPSGVRIADTARVRLGAYIGSGTTIMQEGFVNFNAGTVGPNMVEGRISAGVLVDAGSDLGGGSSTMGTLSGGNQLVLSVGRNCLIGANAGLGISLGDDCTVEAGLYVTAASKVRLLDQKQKLQKTVKALELSGKNHMLFRRNSLDGAIECLPNKGTIELNDDLHSNN